MSIPSTTGAFRVKPQLPAVADAGEKLGGTRRRQVPWRFWATRILHNRGVG